MFCVLIVSACDLQPKIVSIPDNIGMFIEDRYPALLADPEQQPEIYNSAVTDYGVYASPELYGSENIEDYVLYASVDDYILMPQSENEPEKQQPIIEQKTKQEIEKQVENEIMTDYIIVPVYGGNTVIDKVDVKQDDKKIEKKITENKTSVTIEKQREIANKNSDEIIVVRGDTVYALAKKHNMSVEEFAKINNLKSPYTLKIGQKLRTHVPVKETVKEKNTVPEVKPVVEKKKEIPNIISTEKVAEIKSERVAAAKTVVKQSTTQKRINLTEITVSRGDTLYSLSRKYEIPVNDLAVINKISAPFTLSVGQKLKVPKLDKVQTKTIYKTEDKKTVQNAVKTSEKKVDKKINIKSQTPQKSSYSAVSEKQKINTEKTKNNTKQTKQETHKIVARSSSKFSWPLRGKILSGYGPKEGGLVNDGINISANLNAAVKSAENGIVAYAGNEIKGMGNLIIIQHADGWMTVYAHLNSMNVRRGNKVSVGQNIGSVGKTGKVDKPQLHFEIRKGTKSYNPIQYLKK